MKQKWKKKNHKSLNGVGAGVLVTRGSRASRDPPRRDLDPVARARNTGSRVTTIDIRRYPGRPPPPRRDRDPTESATAVFFFFFIRLFRFSIRPSAAGVSTGDV